MNMFEFRSAKRDVEGFLLSINDCLLEQGGVYGIVGPNGCGKSTFLDVLAFLQRPTSGDVTFAGERVEYDDASVIVQYRRRVGYLMQDPYLFNTSVRRNVEYGLKLRGMRPDHARRRSDEMLSGLSLGHLAEKRAHELSGGEAQRVALARTLVLDTDVLLLDEPTANVDERNRCVIEEMLLELNRQKGTTIVFSTHLPEQARRMSGRMIRIMDGVLGMGDGGNGGADG